MNTNKTIMVALAESGWQENNTLNREEIAILIENEGYPVFECVIDFLIKFINTNIYFVNLRNGIQNDDIDFCFEKATHLDAPEKINGNYGERIGKSLCLIGSAYRDYMVLMMASDGSVYGGYDNYVCKIASTGLGAIEAIINNYDFLEIH
ncbi:MAG: SUKH-3 domain-containing protein [Chitinophagaceae bacterium]|nr:SUKH-3 domain-containing protein [Chitinophagaceae bacterium]